MATNAPLSWGLADAIEAGEAETPDWIDVDVPDEDLVLTTPRDALRMTINGRLLRASLSYQEQIRVCRLLGCVSPTVVWSRAIWMAAPIKQNPDELVRTAQDAAQMGTLDFLVRINDAIDASLDAGAVALWGRGAAKSWNVDPMMLEQGPSVGACNFGFVHPNGHEDQPPGGRHNWLHLDYSQLAIDLCKRQARRLSDGSPVDLLELQCKTFPQLAKRLAEEYGP